ncbi:nucleoside diphosphate kinase 7-like [Dendronephthya gigantea]|uniref:nucleoside diphosphate kinase 7-like n=1 Tax=Dendronephthya gigantea TaxID=151771 RepID=UPI00106D107C|nr:nucleoside diphosphate kinase 7-like [Dendronephthya gigantea]
MSSFDGRYAFIADWYDPNAALTRKYQLFYYPSDTTVEMFDIKNKRVFLKRSKCEAIRLHDLHIGAVVNIHSRQLTIKDYADTSTSNRLKSKNEKTFAMVKPDAIQEVGTIIDTIYQNGFAICNMKSVVFSRNEAEQFYGEHFGKPFFNNLMSFMTSGPVLAIELKAESAVSRWRSLIGPTDSRAARTEAPGSLRARFGFDNTKNACHGSDSDQSANRETDFFFGPTARQRSTARCADSTLCIIKPHAVKEGVAGKILVAMQENGFYLNALQMFHMEVANAEEFFEVYKGVVLEYSKMVDELCSGPCIAVEVCGEGDVHKAFRDFVGPSDPEVAKHLRPQTLRAKFGVDKVRNAVHCTDLPDDASLEVEYFFKILNQ